MPLENLYDTADSAWALWEIKENEAQLAAEVYPFENVPPNLSHASKRLEFLAGRVLLKTLLKNWNLQYEGLAKDVHGKPFFKNNSIHLSLSHSYPYVAAMINRNKSVGIDLEQPKDKLLRIAGRVLNLTELQDAGDNITKHCIYWCAKEALIKIYGKRDLILSKNLAIEPFNQDKEGNLIGHIIANDISKNISMHYRVYDNFVVVLNI